MLVLNVGKIKEGVLKTSNAHACKFMTPRFVENGIQLDYLNCPFRIAEQHCWDRDGCTEGILYLARG
jgi:hypothetical protein